MMIDVRVNTNPLGPPMVTLGDRVAIRALIEQYPSPDNSRSLDILGAFLNIQSSNLAVGIGATEFIFLISQLVAVPGGVIFQPTFWEYKESLLRANKQILEVDIAQDAWFTPGVLPLPPLSLDSSRLIFVCNPNNPTGRLYDSEEIAKLAARHPDCFIVVDETYLLFREDYDGRSLARTATSTDNMLVVTSLSKFFAIPGLRLGIACGGAALIASIRQHQVPYGLSTLSEEFLCRALPNAEYVTRTRRELARERKQLLNELNNLNGLRIVPTDANFVLLGLPETPLTDLADYLAGQGVLARSGAEFRGLGPSWIRAAILDRPRNKFLLRALQTAVAEQSARCR